MPGVGRYSPAISLSSVLFPGAVRRDQARAAVADGEGQVGEHGVSSGQEKDRFEQTIDIARELPWIDDGGKNERSTRGCLIACVQGRHPVKRLSISAACPWWR